MAYSRNADVKMTPLFGPVGEGIRLNVVSPGPIDTPLLNAAVAVAATAVVVASAVSTEVARLRGESWWECVDTRILSPLGMAAEINVDAMDLDFGSDFSFTTGGGLSPASFALDDDSDGTLA